MTTDELEESLKRINAESDRTRIKLMTLRAAFINLADGYHTILKIHDSEHDDKNWRKCSHPVCQSNLNILCKLELE